MTYFPPTPGLIGLILRMTWDTDTKTDTDLKTQTRMWIYGRKMNEHFPGTTDHRFQHGLCSRSFSVSNNFAQNPQRDALG